jgi:tRNA(Arg) A34 adenosine deaminase TadA
MNDAEFMRIAIEESKKGDWPYGAVIVNDGAMGGNEPWTSRRL